VPHVVRAHPNNHRGVRLFVGDENGRNDQIGTLACEALTLMRAHAWFKHQATLHL
jgi:hypothetical protein